MTTKWAYLELLQNILWAVLNCQLHCSCHWSYSYSARSLDWSKGRKWSLWTCSTWSVQCFKYHIVSQCWTTGGKGRQSLLETPTYLLYYYVYNIFPLLILNLNTMEDEMKEQKKYAYSRTAFQFDVVVRGVLRYVFCRLECTGNVF